MTNSLAVASTALSFTIHERRIKILKYNTSSTDQTIIDVEFLEEGKTIVCLSRIIDKQDECHKVMKA